MKKLLAPLVVVLAMAMPAVAQAHTISTTYCNESLHGRTSLAGDNDIAIMIADLKRIYTSWTFYTPVTTTSQYRVVVNGVPSPHWLWMVYTLKGNYGTFGNIRFQCYVSGPDGVVHNYDVANQAYHDGPF